MSPNGAYQLVVTHGYDSFGALRLLSEKSDMATTMTSIRCRCNQYPGMFVGTLSKGLVLDLEYMCNFMRCIQRSMSRAWLATVTQDTLHEYRYQQDLEDA